MSTPLPLVNAVTVFGRALALSLLLVGGLAGALGASTYALSAMSEPLWATAAVANDDCEVLEEAAGLVSIAVSATRRP